MAEMKKIKQLKQNFKTKKFQKHLKLYSLYGMTIRLCKIVVLSLIFGRLVRIDPICHPIIHSTI